VIEQARQSLCTLATRRLLLSCVLASLGVAAMTCAVAGRVSERLSGDHLFCLVAWWLHASTLVSFLSVYLGVEAVHGPIEDGTSVYSFLRPVSRAPMLLGTWVACALLGAAIAVFAMASLFAAVAVRADVLPDGPDLSRLAAFATTGALAACAYTAVAVLFGAWFRRPLIWSMGFVVGVQMLAANLPLSAGLRRLTVTDPLRRLLLDRLEPDQRLARMMWPAERVFDPDVVGTPVVELAVLVTACVALAMFHYARTEYGSRDRD
jgi:hypothetical protein